MTHAGPPSFAATAGAATRSAPPLAREIDPPLYLDRPMVIARAHVC